MAAGLLVLAAPTHAESPLVEAHARHTLLTVGLNLDTMAGGKVDPTASECIRQLPPSAYFDVMRRIADRMSIEDQTEIDGFLSSPLGQKYMLGSEVVAYKRARVASPQATPVWSDEEKQQVKAAAAAAPAIDRYLKQGGMLNDSAAAAEVNARTSELLRQCKVQVADRTPSMAPSAATLATKPAASEILSYKPGGVGSESRDAATGAIGTANFFVGRIGSECLSLLMRKETPQEFAQAWQKRNQIYVEAAALYFDKRLAEAKASGGQQRADAVYREAIASARQFGTANAKALLDKPDRKEACATAVKVIEVGAFDFDAKHPMYSELQALIAWAKANP